jgi:uncharacterized protein YkwD
MSLMGPSPRRRSASRLLVQLSATLALVLAVLLLLRLHRSRPAATPTGDAAAPGSSGSAERSGCAGPAPPARNAGFEREVLTLVNAERRKASLSPLAPAAALRDSARWFARDMAVEGYFPRDHDTYRRAPGGLQRVCDWSARISWFYRGWSSLGENIAAGPLTPRQVVAGWMASPPHREKILGRDFSETGVGYWDGGPQGSYWVQDFARRQGSENRQRPAAGGAQ